jgi:hypothetical protein
MRLTGHFLLISFLVPEQKGEEGMEKRGERKREEENRRKYQDPEDVAPPSFLSHLQKLMKHDFLSAVKLETYLLLEDPTLPAPADGFMVSFWLSTSGDSECPVPVPPVGPVVLWP